MPDKSKFNPIYSDQLPNGDWLITLTQPNISGHWTVLVTTDGLSDRVIAPSGRNIPIGPADGQIPAELWYACEQIVS